MTNDVATLFGWRRALKTLLFSLILSSPWNLCFPGDSLCSTRRVSPRLCFGRPDP